MSKEKPRKALSTRSVRAGIESDAQHGSVVPPIYLSTNFAFEAYRKPRKYDYSRSGNPTRDQLAVALTDLEGGAGRRDHLHGSCGDHARARDLAAGRARARAARLLRWHLPAARRAPRAGQIARPSSSTRPMRPRWPRALPPSRSSSGSRRRAIRCCAWSTSAPLRARPTPWVRSSRRTTRSSRRCGSNRSRSERISSCIRRPST